ncbi:MAG: hypothetical protein KF857_02335 [Fimbriimonadaceae bacterium]|nr:hypothetical protein [Fimbriimonadaceae bacterium]
MRRNLAVVVALALPIGLLAQTPRPSPPLREGDMWAAFSKYETGLAKIVGAPTPASTRLSNKVATRAQVLAEMERVFAECKPKFRFTPRPLKVYQDSIDKYNTDPKVRQSLAKMVRWGCVATVGPLVTGPGEGMTAREFGDALGFFMLRMIELTHQPDPKWTPKLQSIDG